MVHHTGHPEIVKRLKRAGGHLQKIVEMIEQGPLIHDHVSQCVNRSLKSAGPAARSALREFKLVARYL